MSSRVLLCPRVPLPAPPAGISFCAVAFQLGSAAFKLPGTEQSHWLVAPRLVSVSPRSKQYSHCASALLLPTGVYGGLGGSCVVSSAAGIWPVMTDIEMCSWPGPTLSMPRNSGRFRNALKYSTSGYWNSCSDCHRHMLRFGLTPETSPLGVMPDVSHVVFG